MLLLRIQRKVSIKDADAYVELIHAKTHTQTYAEHRSKDGHRRREGHPTTRICAPRSENNITRPRELIL